MKKRRKTAPRPKWQRSGIKIRDIPTFLAARDRGDVVYVGHRFRGRPITIKWLSNMSFGMVVRMIHTGSIEIASPTARYMNWLRTAPEGDNG